MNVEKENFLVSAMKSQYLLSGIVSFIRKNKISSANVFYKLTFLNLTDPWNGKELPKNLPPIS